MNKFSKDGLKKFVQGLIDAKKQVIGVKVKDGRFAFGPLDSAGQLRLDYDVTLLSPKKYVLPQVETLMTFEVAGGYKSEISDEKLILIGVHPYDMIAINQMDKLFSQDQYDSHYMARRNNITIIACDVVIPSENVFASSMETATVKSGYDILLTDIGDGYVMDVATDKGKALLEGTDAAEATKEDVSKAKAVQEKNQKELNKHPLECKPHYLPRLLDRAYNHPIWEERAKTCFSCGSCNNVCPTCYCFDVHDEVDWSLEKGQRNRRWDGCLLHDFAAVAGGHNFRKARESRFRHRLYRKAMYVPEKIDGEIACVGCGRCITACVAKIANPVEVYNALLEDIGMD